MDKLPNETLDLVFSNLHLFQKQECMLVCRRWSNIIRSRSLFSTVHLDSVDAFDRLTKVLVDNLSYRLQIRSLIIHDNRSLTLSPTLLLYYFPNLRSVYNKSHQPLLRESRSINLESWRNQIEEMETSSGMDYNPGDTMLSLGVFSNLKRLVINCVSVLPSLSHLACSAPNINSLVIREADISLNDLESIHTNLNALQHLTLENISLSDKGGLNDVGTTNSLITLSIGFIYSHRPSTIAKWLQYITRNCHLLLNFRFTFPDLIIFSTEEKLNITRNGLVPLLQKLGHQLKYIEISTLDGVSTILNNQSVLNKDKQIVRINTQYSYSIVLFKNPQLRDLAKFINQLTIYIDSTTWRSLSYLRFMKTLKRLRVQHIYKSRITDRPAYSNGLFNVIPDSLESLEVFHFDRELTSTMSRRHLLKELTIYSNSIPQSVYQSISDTFPCLNRLTIDQDHVTSNKNIVLWEIDLNYLEISLNQDYFISLTTLDNPILRYYRFGPYEQSNFYSHDVHSVELYKPIHQIAFNDIPDPKKIIHFKFRSVKTFVVNKQLVI